MRTLHALSHDTADPRRVFLGKDLQVIAESSKHSVTEVTHNIGFALTKPMILLGGIGKRPIEREYLTVGHLFDVEPAGHALGFSELWIRLCNFHNYYNYDTYSSICQ